MLPNFLGFKAWATIRNGLKIEGQLHGPSSSKVRAKGLKPDKSQKIARFIEKRLL